MTHTKSVPKKVTIWVHGTRGIAFLPIGFSQKLIETEQRVCFIPFGLNNVRYINPVFYQPQIAHCLADADPINFPLEDFYMFGWCGDVNPVKRLEEARKLYRAIKELIARYRVETGATPEITIIAHSHGGNVALNLAQCAHEDDIGLIKRLILLATPVQKETKDFIGHPLFKKTYSFHSHGDVIQVMDPQKLHPFRTCIQEAWRQKSFAPIKNAFKAAHPRPLLSERHFDAQPNLKQVRCRWKTAAPWQEEDFMAVSHYRKQLRSFINSIAKPRDLLHTEFMLPLFMRRLPQILAQAEETVHSADDELTIDMA